MQPEPVERLVAAFSRLPGVGPKTAQRLAYHVLVRPEAEARALAAALVDVKEKVGECHRCFNLAELGQLCGVCQDSNRDESIICVVERPGDLLPMERTHEFRGSYHVLGGALSPIDGVGPQDIRLDELYRRITTAMATGAAVKEVVVATNPTTSGEVTALQIAADIGQIDHEIVVSRLASGLPVGADLEHADEVTLGRALTGRRRL